jgi:hypothetical protein
VIIALAACGVRALAQSPPIDVPIQLRGYSDRRLETIRAAVHDGASLLTEWFPPAPPGFAATTDQLHSRWFESARGAEAEHDLIRAFARAQWGAGDPFRSALAEYSAAMAIHKVLGAAHVHVEHFFSNTVSYPVRQLPLTPRGSEQRPRLRYFGPRRELQPDVDRWLRSLATLERELGWPALQQAMAALRDGPVTPQRLRQLLSEQTGLDLDALFITLDQDDVDYAIGAMTSEPMPDGGFATSVTVERRRAGMLAGSAKLLPVLVRFDNGDEIRESIDGRDAAVTLQYRSPARASLAAVDPAASLIIDRDRMNNTRAIDPPIQRAGVRLAFNWMTWLQDAMLACTAVL